MGILSGGALDTAVKFVPVAGKPPTFGPVLGVEASLSSGHIAAYGHRPLGIPFAPLPASLEPPTRQLGGEGGSEDTDVRLGRRVSSHVSEQELEGDSGLGRSPFRVL